jgi:hypothetical protein
MHSSDKVEDGEGGWHDSDFNPKIILKRAFLAKALGANLSAAVALETL